MRHPVVGSYVKILSVDMSRRDPKFFDEFILHIGQTGQVKRTFGQARNREQFDYILTVVFPDGFEAIYWPNEVKFATHPALGRTAKLKRTFYEKRQWAPHWSRPSVYGRIGAVIRNGVVPPTFCFFSFPQHDEEEDFDRHRLVVLEADEFELVD